MTSEKPDSKGTDHEGDDQTRAAYGPYRLFGRAGEYVRKDGDGRPTYLDRARDGMEHLRSKLWGRNRFHIVYIEGRGIEGARKRLD